MGIKRVVTVATCFAKWVSVLDSGVWYYRVDKSSIPGKSLAVRSWQVNLPTTALLHVGPGSVIRIASLCLVCVCVWVKGFLVVLQSPNSNRMTRAILHCALVFGKMSWASQLHSFSQPFTPGREDLNFKDGTTSDDTPYTQSWESWDCSWCLMIVFSSSTFLMGA